MAYGYLPMEKEIELLQKIVDFPDSYKLLNLILL